MSKYAKTVYPSHKILRNDGVIALNHMVVEKREFQLLLINPLFNEHFIVCFSLEYNISDKVLEGGFRLSSLALRPQCPLFYNLHLALSKRVFSLLLLNFLWFSSLDIQLHRLGKVLSFIQGLFCWSASLNSFGQLFSNIGVLGVSRLRIKEYLLRDSVRVKDFFAEQVEDGLLFIIDLTNDILVRLLITTFK